MAAGPTSLGVPLRSCKIKPGLPGSSNSKETLNIFKMIKVDNNFYLPSTLKQIHLLFMFSGKVKARTNYASHFVLRMMVAKKERLFSKFIFLFCFCFCFSCWSSFALWLRAQALQPCSLTYVAVKTLLIHLYFSLLIYKLWVIIVSISQNCSKDWMRKHREINSNKVSFNYHQNTITKISCREAIKPLSTKI